MTMNSDGYIAGCSTLLILRGVNCIDAKKNQSGRLITNTIASDFAKRKAPTGAKVAQPAQAKTTVQPTTGPRAIAHSGGFWQSRRVAPRTFICYDWA